MTALEIYEAVLVEVNKVNAPAFLIEEFNYFLNKAILAQQNERYNFYAVNQQLTDDLRVLLNTIKFSTTQDTLAPTRGTVKSIATSGSDRIISMTYTADIIVGDIVEMVGGDSTRFTITAVDHANKTVTVAVAGLINIGGNFAKVIAQVTPSAELTAHRIVTLTFPNPDYFHILSCRTTWSGNKRGCENQDLVYVTYPAKRLTHDILNVIENNVFMRPAFNRTYYFMKDHSKNDDVYKGDGVGGYQNKPSIDVHIGRAKAGINLSEIEVDYLMLPMHVEVTDIDIYAEGPDTSQVLELPDYLKNQIVRRVTDYLLEGMKDPRLQTHPVINQEIPTVPLEYGGQQQSTSE